MPGEVETRRKSNTEERNGRRWEREAVMPDFPGWALLGLTWALEFQGPHNAPRDSANPTEL